MHQFDKLIASLEESLAGARTGLAQAQTDFTQGFFNGEIIATEHAIRLARIWQGGLDCHLKLAAQEAK